MITCRCPECSETFDVPDSRAGCIEQCPSCHQRFEAQAVPPLTVPIPRPPQASVLTPEAKAKLETLLKRKRKGRGSLSWILLFVAVGSWISSIAAFADGQMLLGVVACLSGWILLIADVVIGLLRDILEQLQEASCPHRATVAVPDSPASVAFQAGSSTRDC
jgi:hypothetical protein